MKTKSTSFVTAPREVVVDSYRACCAMVGVGHLAAAIQSRLRQSSLLQYVKKKWYGGSKLNTGDVRLLP